MKSRPIKIDGDIAYIQLPGGYEAIIDSADVPLVDGKSWHARVKSNTIYVRWDTRKARTLLHRFLLNAPTDMEVDHIDRNGLNNRRSNIRLATHSENMRNTSRSKRNTSGLKGVSWDSGRKKWRAEIRLHRKKVHLGMFACKEEAHSAYALACTKLHGEFASIN